MDAKDFGKELALAISAVGMVASVITAFVGLKIALAISELKAYIEKARMEDKEAIKEWVEDHFVRHSPRTSGQ